MQITPNLAFGLVLLACALFHVPEKYRPIWTRQFNTGQMLIGLVAIIAALLIVSSPEFYVLGVLGDSAFFDLLVFAISIQLQMIIAWVGRRVLARVWSRVGAEVSLIRRFMYWRMYTVQALILFCFFLCADWVSAAQKVAQRISG